jgi:hypothetical protein
MTLVTIVVATNAGAAGTPEQQCIGGRYKVRGKYEACIQNALSRFRH